MLYTIHPSGIIFKGVIECQIRNVRKKMSYNSKNIRAVTEFFNVQVDQSFLKLCDKKSLC